jgi:hypothetical protein
VPERAPDPDRGRIAVEPAPSIGRTAETGGDAGAEEAAVSVPAQRGNQAEQESEPTPSGRERRSLRGVLAVAAAVVLLGLAGLVSTMESEPEPEPVAAAPVAAPTTRPSTTPAAAGAVPDAPLRAAVDPRSRPAAAYLDALRRAEVPTSRTGLAETEAAEVICRQLANGTDQATMVRAVPAVLSTVTPAQAPIVVRAAQDHYCGS